MAVMQWSTDLSVGIVGIDRQHQQLIQILNKLEAAIVAGERRGVLAKSASDLVIYTQTHFKAEERLFEEHAYPGAEAHKSEHAVFMRTVAQFQRELPIGRPTASVELMRFLSEWLRTHIKGTDKKYTEFLNVRGIH